MKKPECKEIITIILPAVRASVAESMHTNGYSQKEIAEKLGVVQVAVSKYLHKRYSKQILNMKNYIGSHRMNREVLKKIESGKNSREIDRTIDKLCDTLLAYNLV